MPSSGSSGEDTPPLADVDLFVIAAHLAAVLAALDLVGGGDNYNLATGVGKDHPLCLRELRVLRAELFHVGLVGGPRQIEPPRCVVEAYLLAVVLHGRELDRVEGPEPPFGVGLQIHHFVHPRPLVPLPDPEVAPRWRRGGGKTGKSSNRRRGAAPGGSSDRQRRLDEEPAENDPHA